MSDRALVGRSEILTELQDALVRSADGLATTITLVGEVGMGRTALVAELRRRAEQDGHLVLSTTGRVGDSDLGFSGLFGLMRPIEDRIGELAGEQAGALQAALSLAAGATEPTQVRLGLFRLLTNLAIEQPLLITLDDAHLLDRSTWDALAFAIGRLDADRIAIVVSVEPTSTLADDMAGRSVLLDAMTDSELGRIVDGQAELVPEVRAACVSFASGNPMVAVELVRSLNEGQRRGLEPLPEMPEPPAALARGFEAALSSVPSHLWPALVVMAADVTGEVAVIERVLEDLDQPSTTLDELEQTGFIEIDGQTLHFGHPLLGQFVLYRSSARSRRAAHRSLAATLDGSHHRAARAWHLAGAADGPDETAAAALESVARDVSLRGGAASAARAFERAAEMSPEPARRAERFVEALRCWLAVGDIASVSRATAALEEVPGNGSIYAAIAVGLRWSGGERRVTPRLESALAEATDDDERRQLAALLADAMASGGDRATALGQVAALPDGDDQAGGLAAAVRALLDPASPLPSTAGGFGEVADGDTTSVIGARVRLRTAEAFVAGGRFEAALSALGPMGPVPGWDPGEDEAVRARALMMGGEVGQAFEVVNRRLDQLSPSAELPRAVLLNTLAEVELLMGRLESAGRHLEIALSALQTAGAFGDVLRGRRTAARLALANGDPDRAVSELLISVGRAPEYLSVELASALLMLDRGDEVRRLPPTLVGLDLAAPLPVIRAATAAGILDDDDAALKSAAAEAEQHGLLLEAAEIHIHRAEAAARAGRLDALSVLAAEATSRLTTIGVGGWSARLQRLIDAPRAEARKRVADQLTEAEHRVAVTVAVGRTNKEAAAELFLSQKTIDYHLQNIYRKLGLRGRTELAALLSQGD